MRHRTTVLFDWDGTLLDSFPAGYHASITVLEHYGIRLDRARFLQTYSPNWYESYRMLGVPEEEWPNADRMWRETYRTRASELFPFAAAVLSRLAGGGYTLGLVTSGNRDRVLQELARFGLDDAFAAVVCHEDTEEKKPHPAPLEAALAKLGVEPATTIYVGDRPEDVEMGKRVGSYTIAVESEYGPRAVLEPAAPDVILPDASHLPAHVGLKKQPF